MRGKHIPLVAGAVVFSAFFAMAEAAEDKVNEVHLVSIYEGLSRPATKYTAQWRSFTWTAPASKSR